ncbi:hypothetical protein [Shinella zoogloeoides]|nr:hypothetical protein [Shinella zoogloeoides]
MPKTNKMGAVGMGVVEVGKGALVALGNRILEHGRLLSSSRP